MPHAQTASYWAWRVCQVVGSSRSTVLPKMRPAACWPASRLVAVGRRRPRDIPRARLRRTHRFDHLRRPAVHARRTLRRGGREHDAPQQVGPDERDFLCDEAADREAEQIDTLQPERLDEGDCAVRHRLDRCWAVVPVVAATPTLSNVTTRRSAASASTRAGSQLSRLPRKCCSRTRGTSPAPTSRYAYSTPFPAETRCVEDRELGSGRLHMELHEALRTLGHATISTADRRDQVGTPCAAGRFGNRLGASFERDARQPRVAPRRASLPDVGGQLAASHPSRRGRRERSQASRSASPPGQADPDRTARPDTEASFAAGQPGANIPRR